MTKITKIWFSKEDINYQRIQLLEVKYYLV